MSVKVNRRGREGVETVAVMVKTRGREGEEAWQGRCRDGGGLHISLVAQFENGIRFAAAWCSIHCVVQYFLRGQKREPVLQRNEIN